MTDYLDILGIADLAKEADFGDGVRVAVLDTGIPYVDGISVTESRNFTSESDDDTGHATFVGSILFGNGELQGICRKSIPLFGKVFERISAKPEAVANAIRYAVDVWHADIINLSLGFSSENECPSVLRDACSYAYSKGVLLVAAAGNDGGKVLWPAALQDVICVGSSDGVGKEPFSNYGSVDLVVPGTDVLGLSRDGKVVTKTGTSFSTAIVTGLLALILAARRKKQLGTEPSDLKDELIGMCIDIGVAGWDELTGYGFPFRPIINSLASASASTLLETSIFAKLKAITEKVIRALLRRIKGDE